MAPNSKDIQIKSISTNSFYSSSTRRSVSSIRKKLNGGNSASICINNYNNNEFNNYNDNFNDKKNINLSRKRSFNSSFYSNSYERYKSSNQSNYSNSLNRSKSFSKNEYCFNRKNSPSNRSPSKGPIETTRQLIVAKKRRLFTGEKTSFSPPLKKYFIKENDLSKIPMKKTSSIEDFCKNSNSPDQKKTDNKNLIDKNIQLKNTSLDEETLDVPLERTDTLFKSDKNAYFIKPVTIEEVRIEENKENSLSNKFKRINSLNQISDKTKSSESLNKNTEELNKQVKTVTTIMTNEDDKKEQSLYNESKVENLYPVALRNLGNTCYMNSIVQSLFNLPFLMGELRDSMERGGSINKSTNFSMTKSLIELFEEYKRIKKSQSQNDEELEKRLCAFKYNVGLHSAEFKSSGQHDAVEFLDSVINTIDDEFDKLKKTNSSIINPINKVFKIELGEATICEKCKSKTNIFKNKQHCLNLSLPEEKFMENNPNLSLQNILCNYFKPEKRESECSKCRCLERSRLLSVVKSPKVLILQLGRYSATGDKRHDAIKVPSEILLPQTVKSKEEKLRASLPNKSKNENDQFVRDNHFELSGIICHHGSCMAGGHYICYVHDRLNSEWYQCDDENIVRTTFERVQEGSKSSGYCFFYLNKKYT